jgi:hypothetical protein
MSIRPIRNIDRNDLKDEEDDLFTNKKDYRNSIIDLGMYRPLHKERPNHRVTNSPDYDFNLYDQYNEIQPTFEEYNNNSNYNDFIQDFNMILTPNYNNNRFISAPYDSSSGLLHPPNQNNSLLHPLDYNSSLIHPPNQNNFSFYD